jgi:hypothetical protein
MQADDQEENDVFWYVVFSVWQPFHLAIGGTDQQVRGCAVLCSLGQRSHLQEGFSYVEALQRFRHFVE